MDAQFKYGDAVQTKTNLTGVPTRWRVIGNTVSGKVILVTDEQFIMTSRAWSDCAITVWPDQLEALLT